MKPPPVLVRFNSPDDFLAELRLRVERRLKGGGTRILDGAVRLCGAQRTAGGDLPIFQVLVVATYVLLGEEGQPYQVVELLAPVGDVAGGRSDPETVARARALQAGIEETVEELGLDFLAGRYLVPDLASD